MDLAQKLGREIQEMGAAIDENAGQTTKHTGKSKRRRGKTTTPNSSTTSHMEVPSNGSGSVGQQKAQPNLLNEPNVGRSFFY